MLRLRPLLLLPVVAVLAAAGCGGSNTLAPASVSGSVNYKGKPVTGGQVLFYSGTNGTPYSATIAPDGTYSIADIPAGELVVCVDTESLSPEQKESAGKDAKRREAMMGNRQPPAGRGGSGGGAAAAEAEGKYVKLPAKYANPKTSPVTYTTKTGRQVYNIELD